VKCFVIGGAGFIGSNLIDRLVRDGHEVIGYDVVPARSEKSGRWIVGDFTKETNWRELLSGVDVCFHLAATLLPKASNDDPIRDVRENLCGTIAVLEAARCLGTKIVFSSSGGTIYGRAAGDVCRETDSTEPLCSYGITKLAIERYLDLYYELHGVRSVALRIANPYGPRQRLNATQGAIAVFIGRVLRGHTIDIWGDGGVVRDYVHVYDVVDACIAAAGYGGRHRIMNVGSGAGTSLLDVVGAIERATSMAADKCHHPSRGFDVPRVVLDITRAREELRWEPRTPLDEGVKATVEWVLASGELHR